MTKDWNDLTKDDRAHLAQEIYNSPNVLPQMEEIIHEKELVTVDHRSCMIDVPLTGIISSLWKRNLETIACCQSAGASESESYVAFLSIDDGTEFLTILRDVGITCRKSPRDVTVDSELGSVIIHSMSVWFAPKDIAAIEVALRDSTSRGD